jgi:non-canonical (house-cleaning) NTP pyrophosphatase
VKRAIVSDNGQLIKIAIDRAQQALSTQGKNADFAVGFAEGVSEIDNKVFSIAWCAVVAKSGDVGFGGGLQIELPDNLIHKYRNKLLVEKDIEDFLSQYQFGSISAYEILVQQALAKFKKT